MPRYCQLFIFRSTLYYYVRCVVAHFIPIHRNFAARVDVERIDFSVIHKIAAPAANGYSSTLFKAAALALTKAGHELINTHIDLQAYSRTEAVRESSSDYK